MLGYDGEFFAEMKVEQQSKIKKVIVNQADRYRNLETEAQAELDDWCREDKKRFDVAMAVFHGGRLEQYVASKFGTGGKGEKDKEQRNLMEEFEETEQATESQGNLDAQQILKLQTDEDQTNILAQAMREARRERKAELP